MANEDDELYNWLMETIVTEDNYGNSSQVQGHSGQDHPEEQFGHHDLVLQEVNFEELGALLEHEDDDDKRGIQVILDFGDMYPSQGGGASFMFHGSAELTLEMYTSDNLRRLRGEILRHFNRNLGVGLPDGEEVIFECGGDSTFRECGLCGTLNINVILRSPPVYDLTGSGPDGVIDLVVHGKGFPSFVVPMYVLETVEDLKQDIKVITSIEKEKQMLCYRKKVLEDGSRLADCGLYHNCGIKLVNIGKPSVDGATNNNDKIRVDLFYGKYNLPLPSTSFEVHADWCLNFLKAKILQQVVSYLVIELPTAEEIRLDGASQCDISLGQLQLCGTTKIKVLLKSPGSYSGGVCSTSTRPMAKQELIIVRSGINDGPPARFKLRVHPYTLVQRIKETIEKITGVKKQDQMLLKYNSEEELFDLSKSCLICPVMDLKIKVTGSKTPVITKSAGC